MAFTSSLEQQNSVVSSLTQRLAKLSPVLEGGACIYKIPRKLRNLNEESYTPRVVSLGPYTHGMKGLEFMENVKLRYLETFVNWSGMSIKDLVMFIRRNEAKARACYASEILFSSDEFMEIILLDAVFLLTQLLHWRHGLWKFSHLFEHGLVSLADLRYDLYLLENQLPLFLVRELFQAASLSRKPGYSFSDLLRSLPELAELVKGIPRLEDWDSFQFQFKHLVELYRECYKPSPKPGSETSSIVRQFQSLTELREVGVRLKLSSSSKKLLDIEFNGNGVLEIPHIKIDDSTETVFRNIMALEQCHGEQCHGDPPKAKYVTDYVVAMSELLKTPRDVELLAQRGILQNQIGDNKQVSDLFHNLAKNIYYDAGKFYYAPLFQQLDAHCQMRWKRWNASLKQEYFKNPWKIISVIAAGTLLLLTLIQTVCSIISVVLDWP